MPPKSLNRRLFTVQIPLQNWVTDWAANNTGILFEYGTNTLKNDSIRTSTTVKVAFARPTDATFAILPCLTT